MIIMITEKIYDYHCFYKCKQNDIDDYSKHNDNRYNINSIVIITIKMKMIMITMSI